MQKNTYPRNVTSVLQTALATFIADQALKYFLFDKQDLMNGSWLFGLIRFTNHQNFGISFNLPLPLFLIITITLAALAWSLYQLQNPILSKETYKKIFLGLFIGGIIGNLYDRTTLGYVRDWLLLWGRTAVNLADGAIITGLIGFLWEKSHLDKQ